MDIIFHIGMGKTGTSSIQRALQTGTKALAPHNAHYLGMWFDMIAPRFRGHEGLKDFCNIPPEAKEAAAGTFLSALADIERNSGAHTFIMSNEGFFGEGDGLKPFIDALRPHANIKLIAYMRPAREWLPSAFAQWGIRHKTYPGPIQPFGERAKLLIGQYNGIRAWHQNFSDILVVRKHTKSIDVVADFSEVIGIPLPAGERSLERSEPAEMVLQAMFNNRFPKPVMPERFRRVVLGSGHEVRSVEEMARLCFEHDGLDAIVDGRAPLFDYVRENIGIELDGKSDGDGRTVDKDALRDRILDYLIEITFLQAARIQKLENEIEDRKA
ncbi:hypothetical protein RDV64_23720 (plasmid) [Acuticoccus sp. MNP-M23]|uniref:hypothetical protein n=1 Tax=Acuticoccus sp. MNP-M23 TaxID=3072793 RepID=UPI002815CD73|nr:hypothetical protein [Acuticoccus sp. MNP-M23]WMS45364.1 hypothetical protein RDV64_23720 [Acuticoccus sp. MNP-M23]